MGNARATLGKMMELILGLSATQACQDVIVEVLVDGNNVFESWAKQEQSQIKIQLPDSTRDHCVEIVMSGKKHIHTQFDSNGEVVSDVAFIVDTMKIQDIDVKHIFCQGRACYHHNFNDDTRSVEVDEFYGYIGCNGTVKIEFFTPIYLWLADYF